MPVEARRRFEGPVHLVDLQPHRGRPRDPVEAEFAPFDPLLITECAANHLAIVDAIAAGDAERTRRATPNVINVGVGRTCRALREDDESVVWLTASGRLLRSRPPKRRKPDGLSDNVGLP